MPLSLALAAMLTPLAGAEAAGVAGVETSDTAITIRFDEPVLGGASSFMLTGPDRIALDVAGVDPGKPGIVKGPVARVRQGRFDAQTTRIVFDLTSPATVKSGRFSNDGKALMLALAPIDEIGFAVAATAPRKLYESPAARRAAPPRSSYSLTVPLGPAKSGLPRPRIQGPVGRPLVVIDAGHGGHDPGAISPDGKREKDVTLAVARAVRDQLLASGRVRVALTREDDKFLVLRERSAIARNVRADLFISIHADAAPNINATGATIYTLSEVASDREAQLLAQRENRADVINGVDLGNENREIASILVDLAQRETMNASASFANLLKREGRTIPFRSDFHRMAGFAVLKEPDTPAILLEVGYLTNADDAARLASAAGQANIAAGVRRAVEVYFARRLAMR
jgi:N-acetylmuramoyl-L-alanine amidase